MTIIPPGYLQATYQMRIPGPGSPAMVVCGHEDNPAIGGADAVAAALHDAAGDILMPTQAAIIVLERTRITLNRDGVEYLAETVLDRPGTGVASLSPPTNTFLMQKITGFSGRRNRGRMYWGVIPESGVGDDGQIIGSTRASLNTTFASWINRLALEGLELHLLHNSLPSDPTPVSSMICSQYIGTQRRRLR